MFLKFLGLLQVFGFSALGLFANSDLSSKKSVEFISEVSSGSVPAFILSVTEDEEVKVESSEFKVSDIIENIDLFDKINNRELLSVTNDSVLSCFKTAGRYLGKNFKTEGSKPFNLKADYFDFYQTTIIGKAPVVFTAESGNYIYEITIEPLEFVLGSEKDINGGFIHINAVMDFRVDVPVLYSNGGYSGNVPLIVAKSVSVKRMKRQLASKQGN